MKCICKSSSVTLQIDHDTIIGTNQDDNLVIIKTMTEKKLICSKCGGLILEN